MQPKPAPQLHPEFAEALAATPKAKAALDGFPPSPGATISTGSPTRSRTRLARKRIATAIEWLSEGKRRHWKYEDC